ncbi:MAG TPA: PIN domain-containing protein [Sunxiuqinia sp.]|nr:PIN domain-containing protein [Sunxiuqinia sp.]
MKFVVDTNIVFSAILNPKSPIGQIILNGSKYFTFLSISQLKDEIENQEDKIIKISGLDHSNYLRIYRLITSKIKFVNQLLINDDNYQKANELTHDIDPDDLLFVGLAIQYRCKLWSGDKQLINGLSTKGFSQITTTEELFQSYLDREYKRKRK